MYIAAKNSITSKLVGAWEMAKIYGNAIANEFKSTGYYGEKFKGTTGVGDALLRIGEVYKEGGEIAVEAAKTATKKTLSYRIANYIKENPEKVKNGFILTGKMLLSPHWGYKEFVKN